jgi:hypothetical protein
MPEPCTVQQQKKENKEQQMPEQSEPVFYQKVHDQCFFKPVVSEVHIFLSLYKYKIRE